MSYSIPTPTPTPTLIKSELLRSLDINGTLPTTTKDEIVIKLDNLVIGHSYKIEVVPDNYSAIETSIFQIYASNTQQFIKTLLIKNIKTKIANLQLIIYDITEDSYITTHTFVKCMDYSECSTICLTGTTQINIIDNSYEFIFDSRPSFHPSKSNYKIGYGIGTYYLINIPSQYPMAILNKGYESFISYTGDSNKRTVQNVEGVSYNFYYGTIVITVNGIGPSPPLLSYSSLNNQYMGGKDRLIYNTSCFPKTPTPTPTRTSTPTVTPTVTPTRSYNYFWPFDTTYIP